VTTCNVLCSTKWEAVAENKAGRGGGTGAEVAGTEVADVTGKCNGVAT